MAAKKKKKKNSVEEEEVKKIVSESQSVRSKQGLEATKSMDSVNCVKDEDKKNEVGKRRKIGNNLRVWSRMGRVILSRDWERLKCWCHEHNRF